MNVLRWFNTEAAGFIIDSFQEAGRVFWRYCALNTVQERSKPAQARCDLSSFGETGWSITQHSKKWLKTSEIFQRYPTTPVEGGAVIGSYVDLKSLCEEKNSVFFFPFTVPSTTKRPRDSHSSSDYYLDMEAIFIPEKLLEMLLSSCRTSGLYIFLMSSQLQDNFPVFLSSFKG